MIQNFTWTYLCNLYNLYYVERDIQIYRQRVVRMENKSVQWEMGKIKTLKQTFHKVRYMNVK